MVAPVTLCGCMFGLTSTCELDGHVFALRRARLFEASFPVLQPRHEPHRLPCLPVVGVISTPSWWRERYPGIECGRVKEAKRKIMGCGWMSDDKVAQAIPPAFTRYIGEAFQIAGESEDRRSAAA